MFEIGSDSDLKGHFEASFSVADYIKTIEIPLKKIMGNYKTAGIAEGFTSVGGDANACLERLEGLRMLSRFEVEQLRGGWGLSLFSRGYSWRSQHCSFHFWDQ